MQVIATKQGFDGRVVREKGDEFDLPDGSAGSWFEPTDARAKKAAAKALAQKAKDDEAAAQAEAAAAAAAGG